MYCRIPPSFCGVPSIPKQCFLWFVAHSIESCSGLINHAALQDIVVKRALTAWDQCLYKSCNHNTINPLAWTLLHKCFIVESLKVHFGTLQRKTHVVANKLMWTMMFWYNGDTTCIKKCMIRTKLSPMLHKVFKYFCLVQQNDLDVIYLFVERVHSLLQLFVVQTCLIREGYIVRTMWIIYCLRVKRPTCHGSDICYDEVLDTEFVEAEYVPSKRVHNNIHKCWYCLLHIEFCHISISMAHINVTTKHL